MAEDAGIIIKTVTISLSLFGTICLYMLSGMLYRRSGRKAYMTPLLVCPIIIGTILLVGDISYESYASGGRYVTLFLGPATVAFAVPLYKNLKLFKIYYVRLLTVISIACGIALLSSFELARWIGLGRELAYSIAPRSVTTPLAIAASDVMGGDPTVTAVLVILTGIIGMLFASLLIEKAGVKNSFLKGMLLGITAHGTGTAKAYEDGQKTGVIASLSMIFMGIFTTIIAPVFAVYSAAL